MELNARRILMMPVTANGTADHGFIDTSLITEAARDFAAAAKTAVST
jgi:hypothetical protein